MRRVSTSLIIREMQTGTELWQHLTPLGWLLADTEVRGGEDAEKLVGTQNGVAHVENSTVVSQTVPKIGLLCITILLGIHQKNRGTLATAVFLAAASTWTQCTCSLTGEGIKNSTESHSGRPAA